MASLYSQVDIQELQRNAEESLLHYGPKFYPEIITHAFAQTITTASGHRMLDWTSGKIFERGFDASADCLNRTNVMPDRTWKSRNSRNDS